MRWPRIQLGRDGFSRVAVQGSVFAAAFLSFTSRISELATYIDRASGTAVLGYRATCDIHVTRCVAVCSCQASSELDAKLAEDPELDELELFEVSALLPLASWLLSIGRHIS